MNDSFVSVMPDTARRRMLGDIKYGLLRKHSDMHSILSNIQDAANAGHLMIVTDRIDAARELLGELRAILDQL